MRDHFNNLSAVAAIAAAVASDDPAPITIDRAGFDALTFMLMIGVGGITFTATNRIDFIMEHSDDGATWLPVGASGVLGAVPDASGIVLSQRAAHPAATVHRFGYTDGYQGEKRYVRLRADFNGTHGTGTPIAALAVLGNSRSAPVAA